MIILDKIFTREFPLVLNQLWGRAYDSFFDYKIDLCPIQVFVMKEGISTIYRNPNLHDKVNEGHLKQIKENADYLDNFYDRSLNEFLVLEKIWSKDFLTRDELLDFYEKLTKYWVSIYSAVYIPKYPDLFSEGDRDKFISLRARIDVAADRATDIILKSLAKLYEIDSEKAYYVSYEDLVNDSVSLKNLDKLAKNNLYIIDGSIVTKENFDKIKEKQNFDLEEEEIKDKGFIKGQIAQKGVVKGRVRLLIRRIDVDKLQEGEVLVSYMTIPDYIPAMKKAVAFVTDEGGITCHAAIIAREMKKPCVIGTKIATKLLKDGDLVEVDAEQGIVRKI